MQEHKQPQCLHSAICVCVMDEETFPFHPNMVIAIRAEVYQNYVNYYVTCVYAYVESMHAFNFNVGVYCYLVLNDIHTIRCMHSH